MWHVSVDGVASGPFTEDELMRQARAGALPSGALVWCAGMESWQPIAARFPNAFGPPPVPAARKMASGTKGSPLWPWHLAVITVAGVLAGASLYAMLAMELAEQPLVMFAVWLIAGLGACAILVYAIRWFFKHTESPAHRLFAIMVYGLAAAVMGFITVLPAHQRWIIAYGLYDEQGYALTVDPTGPTLNITGSIGGGISRRFRKLLDENPGIQRVVIDSDGGFLGQANSIAREILVRGLAVQAKHHCASACLTILMSGTSRYVEVGTKLGFHSPYFLEGMSSWAKYLARDSAQQYFDGLRRRGMPEEYIKLAEQTSSEGMSWIDAVRPARQKVLTMTLGGKVIADNDAEWSSLIYDLRQQANAEGVAMAGIFEAVTTKRPDLARKYGDRLYMSYQLENTKISFKTTRDLLDEVTYQGLISAAPEAVLEFMAAMYQMLRDLEERQLWDVCAQIMNNTSQRFVPAEANLESRVAVLNGLHGLVLSATNAGWQPTKVPKADADTVDKIMFEVAMEVHRGPVAMRDYKNPEVLCRSGMKIDRKILELGAERSGRIFQSYLKMFGFHAASS